MKRLLAILKDLQDSGQQATIVGQFSIQHGYLQRVTEISDVHVLPGAAHSSTDKSKNRNRYSTEQKAALNDKKELPLPLLPLDMGLITIILAWSMLPEQIKKGLQALIKTMIQDNIE